ncbi:HsdM family class I SAM-dependent methyltransferase, partial [Bacteroides fragilis]
VYDPCCGSGGMFVQAAIFIEAHGGNTKAVNVYGQESEPATYRLAKMNLAIRGISYHLGDRAVSTFSDDQHKELKFDNTMANPLKKYAEYGGFETDPRWQGYGVPPTSNANYAWILHILNKLNVSCGIAGFLLANGALGDSDTQGIRKQLIESDKVEAIIVSPRNMFYSTDISSVTL